MDLRSFRPQRRSRPDIIHDILTIAKEGAKKTKIVYKANLNFRFLKRYLETLIGSGMIEKDGKLWRTTPKGLRYISRYRDMAMMEISL